MRTRPDPFDVNVERQVLGSLLYANDRIEDVSMILTPDHFWSDANGQIYRLILEQRRGGNPCDFITLATILDQRGKASVATLEDLRALYECVAHGEDAVYHAGRVLALAKRRQQIQAAQKFLRALEETDDDGDDIAAGMVRQIEDIRSDGVRLRGQTFADLARDTLATMEAMKTGGVLGFPTPWPRLDQATGGLEPGRLIVIAGRPGTGKSSFALNLVRAVAGAGVGTYVVSLEMGGRELFTRALASETGLPGDQLMRTPGTLLEHQWRDVENAAATLSGLNVMLDTSGTATIDDVVDSARTYIRRNDVRLLVVDHLGLVGIPKSLRSLSRQQQIGTMTRALKQLALEAHIPVVALAQLNRDSEKREGREPHLADLRESGDIEQDADIVVMIHRDPAAQDTSSQLLIRKNRSGQTGVVPLMFHPPTTTFREPSEHYYGNGSYRSAF